MSVRVCLGACVRACMHVCVLSIEHLHKGGERRRENQRWTFTSKIIPLYMLHMDGYYTRLRGEFCDVMECSVRRCVGAFTVGLWTSRRCDNPPHPSHTETMSWGVHGRYILIGLKGRPGKVANERSCLPCTVTTSRALCARHAKDTLSSVCVARRNRIVWCRRAWQQGALVLINDRLLFGSCVYSVHVCPDPDGTDWRRIAGSSRSWPKIQDTIMHH